MLHAGADVKHVKPMNERPSSALNAFSLILTREIELKNKEL